MENWCRICLRRPEALLGEEDDPCSISIFTEPEALDEVIANMIIDCFNVLVSELDGYPQRICNKCYEKLESAYLLRNQYLESCKNVKNIGLEHMKHVSVSAVPTHKSLPNALETVNVEKILIEVQPKSNAKSNGVSGEESDQDIQTDINPCLNLNKISKTLYREVLIDHLSLPETIGLIDLIGIPCCGCAKVFSSQLELAKHSDFYHKPFRMKTSTKCPHECQTCYQRFSRKSEMNVHSNEAVSGLFYHCKICGVLQINEVAIKQHLSKHDQTGPFCEVEEILEETPVKLTRPYNKRNPPDEDKCLLVQRFKTFNYYIIDGVRCCGCEEVFSEERQLIEHSKKTHLINRKEIPPPKTATECDICYDHFSNQSSRYDRHKRVAKSREFFWCKLCQYAAFDRESMIRHQQNGSVHCGFVEVKSVTLGNGNYVATIENRKRPLRRLLPERKHLELVSRDECYELYQVVGCRCCGCNAVFSDRDSLIQHSQDMHYVEGSTCDPDKFECDICFVQLDTEKCLVLHTTARDSNELHYCIICDITFLSKTTFLMHLKAAAAHRKGIKDQGDPSNEPSSLSQNSVQSQYRLNVDYSVTAVAGLCCCGCNEIFPDEKEMGEHRCLHKRLQIGRKTKHKCNICAKSYANAIFLTNHIKSRYIKNLYQCLYCDALFRVKTLLEKHLASHEYHTGKGGYPCCVKNCIFQSPEYEQVVEHARKEHQPFRTINESTRESEDQHNCEVCSKSFATKLLLIRHKFSKNERKSSSGYVCSVCGEMFNSQALYTAHENRHLGVCPYSCDHCDKTFHSAQQLQAHKFSHMSVLPFRCETCGKTFAHKSQLKAHQTYHLDLKPYSCETCPAKFRLKVQLEIHRRRHTGERPYRCEYCEKAFAHQTDRKRHQMAAHTGEKPHACKHCPATFIRHRQLAIHMRGHGFAADRPFQCEQCTEAFRHNSDLEQHIRKMHGDKGTIMADGVELQYSVSYMDE